MSDINDFLNFDDDANEFSKEYDNINQCDGSPSSEEAELSLSNSVSALSGVSQAEVDLEMCDFTLSTSIGSWDGVSDSFSQMNVKTEPAEAESSTLTLPGSWPVVNPVVALKSNVSDAQITTKPEHPTLHPSSFTMSQIAPPSLPAERSSSTSSSICSETLKEECEGATQDKDTIEPSKKRRASETVRKPGLVLPKTGHKRSSSSISSTRVPVSTNNPPVGIELDASGDPIVAKRQDRLMRNRAAALASRERKREHVTRLESSVVDLENEKNELRMQMMKMNDEIKRLKVKLAEHDIQDESEEFTIVEDVARTEVSPEPVIEESPAENPAVAKLRNAPTGFSPRGALKKSQILANQVAAEEHLRNVTMRQAGLLPPEDKMKVDVDQNKDKDTTDAKQQQIAGKSPRSSGSLIMILIFGIALFTSIPPQNTSSGTVKGLSGWSTDAAHPGLLLNLPASLNNACPETVISQLRKQGFMVAEELAEQGLSDLPVLSTGSPEGSGLTPSQLATLNSSPYLVAKQSLPGSAVGAKFSIIAREETEECPTGTSSLVVTRRRASQVDSTQVQQALKNVEAQSGKAPTHWKIVECQVTKSEPLS